MAHEATHEHQNQLALPPVVTGPTDVTRLQREAEALDEYMHQASLRKGGEATSMPKIPVMLDDIAAMNHLNLLHQSDRKRLSEFLDMLQTKAPVVHMSFATEPSTEFTSKIVTWMRQNIHPLLLVQVGLQPTIAAGCMLRTTNKVFDFSLRQHFVRNRQILVDALGKIGQEPTTSQPVVQSAVPVSPTPTGVVPQ
jgi:hypothetical protein